jgi:hypothetical protein
MSQLLEPVGPDFEFWQFCHRFHGTKCIGAWAFDQNLKNHAAGALSMISSGWREAALMVKIILGSNVLIGDQKESLETLDRSIPQSNTDARIKPVEEFGKCPLGSLNPFLILALLKPRFEMIDSGIGLNDEEHR